MNEPKAYRTRTGCTLSEENLDVLADEVERAEYDVEALRPRRRGRPPMSSGPAEVVPVSTADLYVSSG